MNVVETKHPHKGKPRATYLKNAMLWRHHHLVENIMWYLVDTFWV
jgi:hypothetical protein